MRPFIRFSSKTYLERAQLTEVANWDGLPYNERVNHRSLSWKHLDRKI